jgi:polyhydroxybutyrate depolymerase
MQPGEGTHSIQHGGRERSYLLHTPARHSTDLVLVLHGAGGAGWFARWQSGMNAVSNAGRFLVCYPSAAPPGYWETGAPPKVARKIDDVAFLQAVVTDVEKLTTVGRVFVAGISNGAHMALALGSAWPRIRAVGCVAGVRKPGQYMQAPKRPIPLVVFHGLQDTLQPVGGGTVKDSFFQPYQIPAACEAAAQWARNNVCGSAAAEPINGGNSALVRYPGKAPVHLYLLEDGGHSWPAGRISEAEVKAGCGLVSSYEASPALWQFFAGV